MNALVGLQCHLCKTPFPAEAIYVCDRCLGPLEPVYDYGAIRLTREEVADTLLRQRLDTMSRRYMRDLRRTAYVDVRAGGA